MKAVDVPSLGAFARSHNIRRDLAKVLSDIETAHARGSDVSDHLNAIKQLGACLLRFTKEVPKQPRSLAANEPVQLSLALPTA